MSTLSVEGGKGGNPPDPGSVSAFPSIDSNTANLTKREMNDLKEKLHREEAMEKMENQSGAKQGSPLSKDEESSSHANMHTQESQIKSTPESSTLHNKDLSANSGINGKSNASSAKGQGTSTPPGGKVGISNNKKGPTTQANKPGPGKEYYKKKAELASSPYEPKFSPNWSEKYKQQYEKALSYISTEQKSQNISNLFIHVCLSESGEATVFIGKSIGEIYLPQEIVDEDTVLRKSFMDVVERNSKEADADMAVHISKPTQYAIVFLTTRVDGMDKETADKIIVYATSDVLLMGGGEQRGPINLKFGAPLHKATVIRKKSALMTTWYTTGVGSNMVATNIAASFMAALSSNKGIEMMVKRCSNPSMEVLIQVPNVAKGSISLGEIAKHVSIKVGEMSIASAGKMVPAEKPKFSAKDADFFTVSIHPKPEHRHTLKANKVSFPIFIYGDIGMHSLVININVMTKDVFETIQIASNTPVPTEVPRRKKTKLPKSTTPLATEPQPLTTVQPLSNQDEGFTVVSKKRSSHTLDGGQDLKELTKINTTFIPPGSSEETNQPSVKRARGPATKNHVQYNVLPIDEDACMDTSDDNGGAGESSEMRVEKDESISGNTGALFFSPSSLSS